MKDSLELVCKNNKAYPVTTCQFHLKSLCPSIFFHFFGWKNHSLVLEYIVYIQKILGSVPAKSSGSS